MNRGVLWVYAMTVFQQDLCGIEAHATIKTVWKYRAFQQDLYGIEAHNTIRQKIQCGVSAGPLWD